MTLDERIAAFEAAVNAAEAQYGITIIAGTVSKKLGEHVLVEPVLKLTSLKDWNPPVEDEVKV